MIPLTLCGWIAGWLLFAGLRRCQSPRENGNVSADLSIIIPARDEEKILPRLLRSITQQSVAPREVIVVDDCSRDRTREVAQDYGARVVEGTPPIGWSGKTWACHQGANAAKGKLLLFLDADTWLEPNGTCAFLREFEGGAMSIAPYHYVPTVREQFSCFFHLVMLGGAGERSLLGQSLLIDRSIYVGLGGYRAVKHEVTENFALGKKVSGKVSSRLGRGILNMRMYPHSWREMSNGWSKSFAAGAARVSPLRLAMVVLWITGCVLAPKTVITYPLFVLQLAIFLHRVGSYRILTALLYPLPLLYFFLVFAHSVVRRCAGDAILWKGRPLRAA